MTRRGERVCVVGFGIDGHAAVLQELAGGAASVDVYDPDENTPYNTARLCDLVAGRVAADGLRLHIPADPRLTVHRELFDEQAHSSHYDRVVDTTHACVDPAPLPGCFRLKTLDDAENLLAAANESSRACIVGGGPPALELAEALSLHGLEILLIHAGSRLAEDYLNADESGFLTHLVRRHGVRVLLGRRVISAFGAGRATGVLLDDGTEHESDLVVIAHVLARDLVSEVENLAGRRRSAHHTRQISFRAPGTRVFAHGPPDHDADAEHLLLANAASGDYQRIAISNAELVSATLIGTPTRAAVELVHLNPSDRQEAVMTVTRNHVDQPDSAQPGPERRRLILVGHGMVGHRLIERLVERGASASWDITVLAEEPRPAYDRVHLSSLFDGATAQELSLDLEGRFCAEHGITLRVGDPVAAINRAARTVRTESGAVLSYDTLVLATGSAPFVPPVPGRDAPGCFVYRTIEDVEAITEYAAGCQVGAVIGGGLLGLEAAGALSKLGLKTHVVEFNQRLMAIQIDDAGGSALRRRIEELDITVHTGTRTDEVLLDAGGSASGMRMLSNVGQPDEHEVRLETGIVVFAAGIRARDQLARDCDLPVGERGGVIVDKWCRTEDPAVYAIGECAQASDGKVYGLVAPGYRMAETAADVLAAPHDAKPFEGADTSTKLKLLGVDVASFGDAFGTSPGAHTAVFADTAANVFKKLVITTEGHLLGGILVGDADAYDALRPYSGAAMPLPAPPERYLLPAGLVDAPPSGPDALPDSANICSCHNVAKGTIRAAILDRNATDLASIKSCTKAGTGCGSCVPLLTKILESELTAAGIEVSNSICEHFDHTRAELAEIIRAKRIPTFARLLNEHGRRGGDLRDGCEICKPAIASILASYDGLLAGPAHVLSGEQASLQDTNDHFLANIQRNGSYSVVPRIPGGEITPAALIVIGEVARDFGLYTKITGGQRIDLFGARVEQLPKIWRRLVDAGFESGHAYGKALRTVKSCVGSTWCRYGVQDSVKLAIDLELRYRGLRSPHKLKSAVSGCARECAEAQGKDFGIIATELGWNLYVGGNGGYQPRHADLLAENLDTERLIQVIDRFLMFYIRTADRLERTAPWIERLDGGLEHLKAVVLDDSLGIAADLEAAMQAHVASYQDEWGAVLQDPEKLARFVSFVNAPDAPDPSVTFEVEREQIKPLMQIGRREELARS